MFGPWGTDPLDDSRRAALEQRRLGSKSNVGRILVAIAALGGAATTGVLLWRLWQPLAFETASLPDGTRIILRGTTYGVHHEFDPAGPLARWAKKRGLSLDLPEPGTLDLRDGFTGEDLPPHGVSWLSITGPSPTKPPPTTYTNLQTVWVDEHGCTYPGNSLRWGAWLKPPPEELTNLMLPSDAGEGHRWRLRGFKSENDPKPLFEMPVTSPNRVSVAPKPRSLKPRPIPQEVTSRRLIATLSSLKHQESGRTRYSAVEIVAREKANPAFRWSSIWVSPEDRWGNVGELRDALFSYGSTGTGFLIPGLCMKEPAWKIRAELAPDPWCGKPPDYDWGHFRLPVGLGGEQPTEPGRSAKSKGLEIWIQANPRPTSESTGEPRNVKELVLLVGIFGNKTPIRMAIKSINGEPFSKVLARSHMEAGYEGEATGLYDFGREQKGQFGYIYFPNPDAAKRLDLELIGYSGAEYFEFVVKP